MINNKWEKIKASCPEHEQFLNKLWFDSWHPDLVKNNNWQGSIRYATVEASNENCAIIPYSLQTVGPFNFASLAGNYHPHRGIPNSGAHPDLIENTADKFSKILKTEGSKTLGFRMSHVLENNDFIGKLKETLIRKKWKCLSIDLFQNFGFKLLSSEDEFMATLSSKRKYKLRRSLKRMESDGAVEMKCYNDVPEDQWAKIFKELELVESKAWIASRSEPKFIGQLNQHFWNSLVTDEWFRRAFHVWIIYFNEKPVSYSIDMDTEHTRYGLCTSYDKEISKYRTGVMLLMKTMVQAIEAGKKIFDAGGGDTGYKTEIGAIETATFVDYYFFPPTFKGRLTYYSSLIKLKLEMIIKMFKQKNK